METIKEKDAIDLQIKAFQEHPQFDPKSLIPDISDEEREKYTTGDGTFNHLAYEKDHGKLPTMSDKAERELNKSFRKFLIGFGFFVAAAVAASLLGMGGYL